MVQDGCRRRVTRRRYTSHNLSMPGAVKALLILLFLPAAVLPAGGAEGASEPVDISSWIYPAFRTLELAGFVDLPSHMPWSRAEAETLLDTALRNSREETVTKGGILTPRQEHLFERLKEEFRGESGPGSPIPGQREDRPLLVVSDGQAWASLDLTAGAAFIKSSDEGKGRLEGVALPELLLNRREGFSAGTTYRLRMRPERDLNSAKNKPSAREKSFRGLASEYERGWIAFRNETVSVLMGRDYVHWGNGREESLILSRQAGSIDQLSFDISLGRFRLHNIHAVLSSAVERHLAGHRLEVSLPASIRLGVSETVVYSGRTMDWSYLLPFGSYYANQYNENDDDNILWAIDWKIPLRRGLIFFGEFLVDDFQYEDRGEAPDRLGFNLSLEGLFYAGAREVEWEISYTWIDIYTYAHKDSMLTRYTAGEGSTSDLLIGSSLGPDSDRWELRVSVPVTSRILCRGGASFTRRGEGSDLREWVRGTDPGLPFPSGEVTEESDLYLGVTVDLGRGSSVSGEAGLRSISGGEGSMEDGHGFLGLILDF